MIAAMKKLFLVVHEDVKRDVVNKLQDLGVVHIVQDEINSDELTETFRYKNRLEKMMKSISKNNNVNQKFYDSNVDNILSDFESKMARREEIKARLNKLKQEHKILLPWGRFDKSLFKKLDEAGLKLSFYVVPIKKFQEFDFSSFTIEEISRDVSRVYFVKIDDGEKSPLQFDEVVFEKDIVECEKEINNALKEMENIDNVMKELSCYKDFVSEEIKRVNDDLNNKLAHASLDSKFDKILSIVGWVPHSKINNLKEYLDNEKDIVYEINSPEEGDEVPVLLKNGFMSRLFEPITSLFSLPSYGEFDLTPFFAPFFAMFFGLCLGDSGYGLLLLFSMIFAFIKFKKFRSVISLGIILSLCTVFWGVLTGTIFGVNLFKHEIPFLSGLAYLESNHVFYLALLIGLFQILFGMIVKTVNRLFFMRDLSGLSSLGWAMLVFFGSVWYLKTQSSKPEGFEIGIATINFSKSFALQTLYILMGVGTILILLFNDMKVNIFLRFGKGLWELYGITGVAGDLLSYIRLFALGISSAILGTVINSIALQILSIDVPVLSHFLFIIFLVCGHLGNLLLASLGSFVHPLRLTFVEFYKNAGFEGGGKPYSPLRREYNKGLN